MTAGRAPSKRPRRQRHPGPPDALVRLAPALRVAAARYGTPLYVTDQLTLSNAAAEVAAAFPDPGLRAFSIKANDVAGITTRLAGLGFDANVVSRGEWAVARRAGLPNHRITLEGVGKTDADLRAAWAAAAAGDPLRWIAIESLDEATALIAIAGRRRTAPGRGLRGRPRLDVLFRLNPEVTPETIRSLAVGAASSKFGMTADELTTAVELVAAAEGLEARGVHLHVGSQLRAVDAWRDAVRRALAVLALVRGSRPTFDTLDLGGGFPVVGSGEAAPTPARFARELPALLDAIPAERRPTRFAIEPGRFLVARAGLLVGRVLHVRERGGRQVVLDTGMTELIRPALYGARHEIVALTSLGRPLPGNPTAAAAPADAARRGDPAGGGPALAPARVEGPICESTDHLGDHLLPPLQRGDLVAIRDAGAYGASLASSYNGRDRPAQVIVEPDGSLTLLRRRRLVTGA